MTWPGSRGRQRYHKGAEAADGLVEPGPESEGQAQPEDENCHGRVVFGALPLDK